jgi:hypothetical protein
MDSGGLVFEKQFKLDVNDINEKPTDLQLSELSLDENISHGTFVATLSTTDPDSNESHVYSFESGEGGEDNDNGNFVIEGNQIKIIDSPDFEEKSVYSIRLKTMDSGGLVFEKQFKLDVNDINEKPTDLQLSKLSLDENISHGTFVATLSTTDPDSNESHVYSFESGEEGEDNDNGNFLIEGNQIKIIDSPDFEEKSVYSIRLKTMDSGGLNFEKEFKLGVNDINEKPTELHLSNLTLDENISYETFVATLSSTDPDSNESHVYSFESGEGGEDNDKFMIKGNQLLTSPNFEKKESYSIRLNTSDAEGLDFVKKFRLMGNYGNQFNIIKSTFGKGKLRGTKNADQFTFDQFEPFAGTTADKIIGFAPSQGDTIGVSAEAFPSLLRTDAISFASASTKRELKLRSRENYDFVYFKENGRLFFNGNGDKKGWGESDEGGLFAILKNNPEISSDDFTHLV